MVWPDRLNWSSLSFAGQDYNHQVLNPSNECQLCDLYDGSSKTSGTWTNRPAVLCNDKKNCTMKDTCRAGKCVGVAYSCQSSYHFSRCIKTSECVGDGTCRPIMRPKRTICRAVADNCDKPERYLSLAVLSFIPLPLSSSFSRYLSIIVLLLL